jgi:hypothetical protein
MSVDAVSDDFDKSASLANASDSCITCLSCYSSLAGLAKSIANPFASSLLDLAFAKKLEFTYYFSNRGLFTASFAPFAFFNSASRFLCSSSFCLRSSARF